MARNLDQQMDLFGSRSNDFKPIEPLPINPITGDPELSAPFDEELLAKSRKEVEKLPRDIAEGVITAPLTAAGDIVDLGAALPAISEEKMPLYGGTSYSAIEKTFEVLSDLGISRDNAVKLINENTPINLEDSAGEFIGETFGITGTGIAKATAGLAKIASKYGDDAGKYLGEIGTELRDMFAKSTPGGDDFDGMAPATVTDTPSVTAQTDQVFDVTPTMPDTSVSPTMVGTNTGAGRQAVTEYDEMKNANPDMDDGELFAQTGVYMGPDGKPRFELDTTDAKLATVANDADELVPVVETLSEGSRVRLDEILDFRQLMDAYDKKFYDPTKLDFVSPVPISDMAVEIVDPKTMNGAAGSYSYVNMKIKLSSDLLDNPDQLLSVLMHEVQHAVQHKEGFTGGSNKRAFIEASAKALDPNGRMGTINNMTTLLAYRDRATKAVKDLAQFEQTQLQNHLKGTVGSPSLTPNVELETEDIETFYDMQNVVYEFLKKAGHNNDTVTSSDLNGLYSSQGLRNFFDQLLEEGGTATTPEMVEEVAGYKSFLDKLDNAGNSDQLLRKIMRPAMRSKMNLGFLRDVEETANANYYRKYGEVESRLVQERDARRKELLDMGFSRGDIFSIMRDEFPPLNYSISKEIMEKGGFDTQDLDVIVSHIPDRRGSELVRIPEDFTLLEGAEMGLPQSLINPTSSVAKDVSDEMISVFPKPERMFPEVDRPKGGDYINPQTGEVLSGRNVSSANIKINPDGKPSFKVSNDDVETVGSTGKGKSNIKVNLFKKKAGWKWDDAPEDYANIETLVSVEHKGKHYYTVETDFTSGVNLKKYPDSKTEPRLRPTLVGSIEIGEPVGTISVRGKQHPVYSKIKTFNKGGVVPMKKQMDMFADGGLEQDGGTIDPVSGNDVPPGSTQEEVRDDIPAQLSEGEFVFPADVVRYWGLDTLMRMRQQAKMGLRMMEEMGQMGNSEEATIPDDVPFDINDLDMEEENEYNMAQGGYINAQQGTFVPGTPQQQQFGISGYQPAAMPTTGFATQPVQAASQQFVTPTIQPAQAAVPTMQQYKPAEIPTFQQTIGSDFGSYDEIRQYKNEAGNIINVPFRNGQPVSPIPEGYKYVDPEETATEEVTTTPTTPQTTQVREEGDDDERRRKEEETKYGPGGGRLGVAGEIYGVSFDVPEGVIPGMMGAAKLLPSLIAKGQVPEGVSVNIKQNDVEFSVSADQYNDLQKTIKDFGANSEEAKNKLDAIGLGKARREAKQRAFMEAQAAKMAEEAKRKAKIEGTLENAIAKAQQMKVGSEERQEAFGKRDDSSASGFTPGSVIDRAVREATRESQAFDRAVQEKTRTEADIGYDLNAGGLASKRKPKAKKMKQGGLASKK